MYNLWLVLLILGIICIVVALILMCVFRVPDLIDELSGRKAKRQIKKLKELNVNTTGGLDLATEDILSAPVDMDKVITPDILVDKRISDKISGKNTTVESNNESHTISKKVEISEIENDSNKSEGTTNTEQDTSELSTEYLEETSFMSDIEDYKESISEIELIEEQTSLEESL